jgi:hypothetical protein
VFPWFPFFSLRRIISARSIASSTESILQEIILLFRERWLQHPLLWTPVSPPSGPCAPSLKRARHDNNRLDTGGCSATLIPNNQTVRRGAVPLQSSAQNKQLVAYFCWYFQFAQQHSVVVVVMGRDNVSELLPLTDMLFITRMIWVWRAKVEWYWLGKTECPSTTLPTTNLKWIDSGANPGLRGERPTTNRLSHGTAQHSVTEIAAHTVSLHGGQKVTTIKVTRNTSWLNMFYSLKHNGNYMYHQL